LALARLRIHTPACAAALGGIRRINFLHASDRLFLQPTRQQPPATRTDAPIQSSFLSHVPAGLRDRAPVERVMLGMFRFSMRTISNWRASLVEVFSAQSLRRSASRAFRLAIAILTCLRLTDPRRALASLRPSRRSRARSVSCRVGQRKSSPVDRAADTAMPQRGETAAECDRHSPPPPETLRSSQPSATTACRRCQRSSSPCLGEVPKRQTSGQSLCGVCQCAADGPGHGAVPGAAIPTAGRAVPVPAARPWLTAVRRAVPCAAAGVGGAAHRIHQP
jgi:hypothetical protein